MPKVFTIGYERRNAAALVSELLAADVEVLVDVRELPLSRRPGFSKTALGERLRAAGIAYSHDRALGNPKPLRELYWAGRLDEGSSGYLRHLRNGSAPAVRALAARLQEASICLLCLEHDQQACHRSALVSELQRHVKNLRVEHL